MRYTVAYKPSAEQELAAIWNSAIDRQMVTEATNRIDDVLEPNPEQQGESRDGATRIMFERPLAVQFELREQDRYVEVLKVWWIGD
jgi:hypothetical protein